MAQRVTEQPRTAVGTEPTCTGRGKYDKNLYKPPMKLHFKRNSEDKDKKKKQSFMEKINFEIKNAYKL